VLRTDRASAAFNPAGTAARDRCALPREPGALVRDRVAVPRSEAVLHLLRMPPLPIARCRAQSTSAPDV